MAFGAALPKGVELQDHEAAATFVVPAPKGCNLSCPFCIIRARREAPVGEDVLTGGDYVRFIQNLSDKVDLGLISVVGHEPLLPESWNYTKGILEAANRLSIPTAIITNGTHLAERADELAALDVKGITVSLDAATPEHHDLIRRTTGAHEQTLGGLRKAMSSPLRNRILVNSTLQPGKAHLLDGMPLLLKRLGMTHWIISNLFIFSNKAPAGPAESTERILQELLRLQDFATPLGINLLVDDEFDVLLNESRNAEPINGLRRRHMKRIDQILRLGPTGTFSIGQEVLCKIGRHTPKWIPSKEEADVFITRCLQRQANNTKLFSR